MEIHGQFMTIHGDISPRRQPRSARRSEQHESTEGWCAISEHPSKLMSLMFLCLKQKIPRLRGFIYNNMCRRRFSTFFRLFSKKIAFYFASSKKRPTFAVAKRKSYIVFSHERVTFDFFFEKSSKKFGGLKIVL